MYFVSKILFNCFIDTFKLFFFLKRISLPLIFNGNCYFIVLIKNSYAFKVSLISLNYKQIQKYKNILSIISKILKNCINILTKNVLRVPIKIICLHVYLSFPLSLFYVNIALHFSIFTLLFNILLLVAMKALCWSCLQFKLVYLLWSVKKVLMIGYDIPLLSFFFFFKFCDLLFSWVLRGDFDFEILGC